ncbi:hypothetical protein DFH09DRAFT_1372255 [Mycena vulgaris]|nr:hypothetical protein DFH09DRAFT_1372255 [Mycena vulgaris]
MFVVTAESASSLLYTDDWDLARHIASRNLPVFVALDSNRAQRSLLRRDLGFAPPSGKIVLTISLNAIPDMFPYNTEFLTLTSLDIAIFSDGNIYDPLRIPRRRRLRGAFPWARLTHLTLIGMLTTDVARDLPNRVPRP